MIRLASIVSRTERHMGKARELAKRGLSDGLVFDAVAMECFQAVNSAIDLGEFIVSERNLGLPSRYKEIFELLCGAKIISRKTLGCIKRLVFLRNLISHEYYSITEKELGEMADRLGCLEELVKKSKRLAR